MKHEAMIVLLVVLAFGLGCNGFETQGVTELGPATWEATLQCGKYEPMVSLRVGEVVEIDEQWSCQPQEPKDGLGRVLCWAGDAEFQLISTCEFGNYKSEVYFGKCQVKVTCEGKSGL